MVPANSFLPCSLHFFLSESKYVGAGEKKFAAFVCNFTPVQNGTEGKPYGQNTNRLKDFFDNRPYIELRRIFKLIVF